MRISVGITGWFNLGVFNTLSLTFDILSFCLGVDLLFDLVWDTLCFLDLDFCVLSHIREVFSYHFFK